MTPDNIWAAFIGVICFSAALAAILSSQRARERNWPVRVLALTGAGLSAGCGLAAVYLLLLKAQAEAWLPTAIAAAVAGLAAASGLCIAMALLRRGQGEVDDDDSLLLNALSYMTQGLCMFDGQGRLVLWNKRYAELYGVQDRLKTGFTLRDILVERTKVGTFSEDPDAYTERVHAAVKKGKTFRHVFSLPDGRQIACVNEVRPTGGWVSTHEDITQQIQIEQERAAIRDKEQHRAVIDAAIGAFRAQVENLLTRVSESASAMHMTATSLFAASQQNSQRATDAVRVFNEVSGNSKTAADAAEELWRSIGHITQELVHSREVVQLATREAEGTDGQVAGLSAGAQKIGDVVELIREIAGQTNLLALNATIEAARAGEAGRGFAVVASEVKTLSVQTSKATEDVANHIRGMQNSATAAVEAIRSIATRMQEINTYTSSVVASVEQQNAATRDISYNVAKAAEGTKLALSVLDEVAGAATDTRSSAEIVLSASETVESAVRTLRSNVEGFLAKVAV